uniref:Uncharacterized protein n=1 Tax=Percolomonas cosmopolitus TaxID=63605 RepID=A0A7S1KTR0_9EUKA
MEFLQRCVKGHAPARSTMSRDTSSNIIKINERHTLGEPASFVPQNAPLCAQLRILPLDNKLHILSFLHNTQLRAILRQSPTLKPIFRSHSELKTVLFSIDDLPVEIISKNIIEFLGQDSITAHSLCYGVSASLREDLLNNEDLWRDLSARKLPLLRRMHTLTSSALKMYPRSITNPHKRQKMHYMHTSVQDFNLKTVFNPREAVELRREAMGVWRSITLRFIWDFCKVETVIVSYCAFALLAYSLILWLTVAVILIPALNWWWCAYMAYALALFASMSYVAFVFSYIVTLDYYHPIFSILRRNAWVEWRFFRLLGLGGEYKNRTWNVIQGEMLLHFLWVPLLTLLYSVKWIVDLDARNWTLWTLPIFCIWAVYVVSALFHSLYSLLPRKLTKFCLPGQSNEAMRHLARLSHWSQFVMFTVFYALILSSALMILGKVDGWASSLLWSIAFIPLEVAFLLFVFISDLLPIAYFFTCCIEEMTRPRLPLNIVKDIEVASGLIAYQASNFLNLTLFIDRVWPFFISLILMGLQLDGIIAVDWAWIMCPMLMWTGVECIVCNMCCGCGYSLLYCVASILSLVVRLISGRN